MTFQPDQPYNDLPPLPPDAELETNAVLKKCIAAHRALAQLKAAGDLIPNPAILINSIPLQEAMHSSEIENIVTTQDDLFKAAAGIESANQDPHAKEVLRYRTALHHGFHALAQRPLLSTNLFDEICTILRQVDTTVRKTPDTALRNKETGQVIYTPPVGETVIRNKLANLEKYIHDDEDGIDPLIKMAVIHYQFEAIHPYEDGNGRTGRIINLLYLVQKELLKLPVLYMSGLIIDAKIFYYLGLRDVTESALWEKWILFILDVVEASAKITLTRIKGIREIFDITCALARQQLPARTYSKELIELIFTQPYCKIQFLVDAGLGQRQAASRYLRALERIGILESVRIGRERVYLNLKLLKILKM